MAESERRNQQNGSGIDRRKFLAALGAAAAAGTVLQTAGGGALRPKAPRPTISKTPLETSYLSRRTP
jgi:hypothetical protein